MLRAGDVDLLSTDLFLTLPCKGFLPSRESQTDLMLPEDCVPSHMGTVGVISYLLPGFCFCLDRAELHEDSTMWLRHLEVPDAWLRTRFMGVAHCIFCPSGGMAAMTFYEAQLSHDR